MNWQKIETAPKDGSIVLAFGMGAGDGKRQPFCWADGEQTNPMQQLIYWVEGWYDKEVEVSPGLYRKVNTQAYAYWGPHPNQFTPTHWMPLPEGPK